MKQRDVTFVPLRQQALEVGRKRVELLSREVTSDEIRRVGSCQCGRDLFRGARVRTPLRHLQLVEV